MDYATMQMTCQQHKGDFAYLYFYFALSTGRLLHDGWRSA